MYYELYVDVLFLVNFAMDYLLLLIVRRMLSCSATHGRICLGAAVGSLLTCLVVIVPIPYTFVKLILFHLVVNTIMIRVGLKIKSIRTFVKAVILLYIGGVLLGGIMEALRPYVRMGSLFLVAAIGGYYLVLAIWKFIALVQRWNSYHCEAKLYMGNDCFSLRCLVDTGNQLIDPVSGKAVSILERRKARELMERKSVEKIRYIPYRTIGESDCVLAVFEADRLQIFGEHECVIEAPLIGISEGKISAGGEYEMILNPNLF